MNEGSDSEAVGPGDAPDAGETEPDAVDTDPTVRRAVPDAGEAADRDPDAADLLPSTGARLIGFAAILLAGAAGAFIGYAVTDLQCQGDCTTARGIGGLIGAAVAAIGVAIVVQLALRAMFEWRVVQTAGGPDAERQRQRARERRQPPPATRPRPRVR